MTVPGLLIVVVVLVQIAGGLAWLPFARPAASVAPRTSTDDGPLDGPVRSRLRRMDAPREPHVPPAAGLCHHCRHARALANDRGSVFVLCERSRTDTRFPRYPPLPVLACAGFEVAMPGEGSPDDPA